MRVFILLANPKPDSFCHALAHLTRTICQELGHQVAFHDLYAEGFDPILSEPELRTRISADPLLEHHCAEIRETELLVVVHPNWWGQPPALLKGWLDRVLRSGVAYAFLEGDGGEGVPVGLLKAHTAIVFNTSDTPIEREREVFGDPLEALWGKCILPYCGIPTMVRHTYSVVVNSTQAQREAWLNHAEGTIREVCINVEATATALK